MNTKFTRGKLHANVFHRLFPKWNQRAVLWAINLKPGDAFNSFDCLDHVVKSIKIEWSHASDCPRPKSDKIHRKMGIDPNKFDSPTIFGRKTRGEYISEVTIYSTNEWQHSLSETGCIVPSWGRDRIRETLFPECFDYMESVGIIDSNGVRLRSSTLEEKDYISGPLDTMLKATYGEWEGMVARPDSYVDYIMLGPNYPPLSKYKQSKTRR